MGNQEMRKRKLESRVQWMAEILRQAQERMLIYGGEGGTLSSRMNGITVFVDFKETSCNYPILG